MTATVCHEADNHCDAREWRRFSVVEINIESCAAVMLGIIASII